MDSKVATNPSQNLARTTTSILVVTGRDMKKTLSQSRLPPHFMNNDLTLQPHIKLPLAEIAGAA
jgi:hypothetical protein